MRRGFKMDGCCQMGSSFVFLLVVLRSSLLAVDASLFECSALLGRTGSLGNQHGSLCSQLSLSRSGLCIKIGCCQALLLS